MEPKRGPKMLRSLTRLSSHREKIQFHVTPDQLAIIDAATAGLKRRYDAIVDDKGIDTAEVWVGEMASLESAKAEVLTPIIVGGGKARAFSVERAKNTNRKRSEATATRQALADAIWAKDPSKSIYAVALDIAIIELSGADAEATEKRRDRIRKLIKKPL